MLQARACISALSKSHLTNAAPLLNSLRRTIPKHKQKFDKTGRKKSTRVCVWNLNFYLPCWAIASEFSNAGIFHSKLSSNFQTGNVVTYPFLKVTHSFPNLQEQK